MANSYGKVSVGNTATLIIAENVKRQALYLCNAGISPDIFLGQDSNVTASTGFPLFSGSTKDMTKNFPLWNGPIYGISSSGTADIRFWENER